MSYRRYLAMGSLLAMSAGAAVYYARQSTNRSFSDDAPGRTARRLNFGGFQVAGRTVTINAAPEEIHSAWHDAAVLQQVFGDEITLDPAQPGMLAWTIATGFGETRVETRIIEDRPGEQIAWRSADADGIDLEAKVRLRPASEGRGTVVEAHVAWRPPMGVPGHLVSKLRGADPATVLTHALKRLKMLLETGEIATNGQERTA